MDSQNIYYDSFTASTGENGYDGTLEMCQSRSSSNPQSPGFAFSDTNACTIYMNNGQVPIGFEVPLSGMVTTNYGSGPINKASGHFGSSCYRKLTTTTTTSSTESVASSSSSTSAASATTTTTATAAPGFISSSYSETTDAYCSNAMEDGPSILSRYDSFESCWEYCAAESTCAACFQPCLDGTGGGCNGAQGCQFLAVSLCSAKTADGCGARIWRRYGSAGDPMLAVRIVLIVVGALVFLGLITAYCYWKRRRAATQRPLIPPKAVSPAAGGPPADTVGVPAATAKALTRAKSIALSSEEGQAMDSATKESLPRYWGHARESTDFNAMLYSSDDQLEQFTELLNHTYRARCTQDRPCPKGSCSKTPGGCPCVQPDGDPGLPASYVVRRVIRVEDSRMWKRFMTKRDQIRRSRGAIEVVEPQVCTSGLVKEQPGTFMPLDEGLNEFYLWHGTHVRAALSIAHEDFRIDMAGSNAGTMYGKGCYLAENCTKADEYARDEPHGYYEGVFALLLCRVCMGKFLYTTDRYEAAGDKVRSGEFDSTVGDRTKKANTFREFVVYHADQVYPEYVILYSRRPRAVALETFKFELGSLSLHAELPVYWQHCHVNPGVNAFEAQYAVRATSRMLLQQLAQACFPGGAGGSGYIKVVSARRIEMSSMWNRYVQFKRRLRQELEASGLASFASAELLEGKAIRGEILTYSYLKNLTGKGVQATGTISIDTLDDNIQEHLLWHGTSRASAEAIVSADFRIPKDAKHGFRFGSGLYFAEDIGKSLSYVAWLHVDPCDRWLKFASLQPQTMFIPCVAPSRDRKRRSLNWC
ncbi:Parp12 [Symbiodinium natans]|uniref:Poly [ADP-ribose] polymerase n=1 Tax=Symbiodinium natans TaxID=878477 RepID=A0A812HZ63_9DINO|nr:Parp12 [Symbiodinium natans]